MDTAIAAWMLAPDSAPPASAEALARTSLPGFDSSRLPHTTDVAVLACVDAWLAHLSWAALLPR